MNAALACPMGEPKSSPFFGAKITEPPSGAKKSQTALSPREASGRNRTVKGHAVCGSKLLSLKTTGKALELRIRVELATTPGVRMWQHHAGRAGEGGRRGLGVGVSDLVGIVMMPNGIGRFFAGECKDGAGRLTLNQKRWINTVRRFGGYACELRSVEDARRAVLEAMAGVHLPPLAIRRAS